MACKELYALLRRRKLQRPPKLTEDHVLSILCFRRARDGILGQNLFADPAWDILLELYAASLADRLMSEAELARAIGLPPSVTGRWIAVLEERGLTRRTSSRGFSRTAISLTEEAISRMGSLADHWGSAFLSIGYPRNSGR